ncbi:hypothetical protein [Agrobacterium sp.]|uniref:hypothetical protein n=1 Tax=Agrobacterium sp. TaxID=361 RepID=UPI002897A4AF|nr:hypothetical protein [Agrobacterium sp.]
MYIIKKFNVTDQITAAADAFVRHLKTYENDFVRETMSSNKALRAEVMFWHEHETENQDHDGVFEHADMDPAVVADAVVTGLKDWHWRDVTEYDEPVFVATPEELADPVFVANSQGYRKLRKNELAISEVMPEFI